MGVGDAREQRDRAGDGQRQEVVTLAEQLRANARIAALEERLELARQAEAVVAISQMVAHDINNLLGAIPAQS